MVVFILLVVFGSRTTHEESVFFHIIRRRPGGGIEGLQNDEQYGNKNNNKERKADVDGRVAGDLGHVVLEERPELTIHISTLSSAHIEFSSLVKRTLVLSFFTISTVGILSSLYLLQMCGFTVQFT